MKNYETPGVCNATPADIRVSVVLGQLAPAIDGTLEEVAGERYGFMLIVAPFDREGEEKPVQHISNFQPGPETLELLETVVARLKARLDFGPLHKVN